MSRIDLALIESRMAGYHPEVLAEEVEAARYASVAAILRETPNDVEVLFILRATKEGDPWSGHMAFPGGHREPHDDSLQATAERETLEEIGLDLTATARCIGRLEPVMPGNRATIMNMAVTPFVFVLEKEVTTFTPNYEVADVLWGSVNDMYNRSSLTESEFEVNGRMMDYPGYSVGDHVVWGMTLRMLDDFFAMLDEQWQPVYS